MNELSFMERFKAALTLSNDGSAGRYRGETEFNLSGSSNDSEAVYSFLSQYKHSPATLRTYTRECERFHMWCVLWLKKSITDLNMEDFQLYIDFLHQPDKAWITEKKVPKSSLDWRPFNKIENDKIKEATSAELSENAVKVAIASINSMLSWMVDSGYLRINALKILRNKSKLSDSQVLYHRTKKVERFLDQEMWDACIRQIELMPKTTDLEVVTYERVRFIMTMFSMLGARVSEMSNSLMSDIHRETAGWFWEVVGKGNVGAKVAIPQDLIEGLMRWRAALGLSAIHTPSDKKPIIPAINRFGKPLFTKIIKELNAKGKMTKKEVPRYGLSSRRISEITKAIFERAAKDTLLPADKREILKKASVHWLRHTSITQKIAAGMDRKKVQDDARHADMKTTDGYAHDEEIPRVKEAQKHRLRWVDEG